MPTSIPSSGEGGADASANGLPPSLALMGERLSLCEELRDRIGSEIQPDPPQLVTKGNVIAAGYSKELDELRNISSNGRNYLLQIQEREVEKTGISSLKIGYNNVFGYYLEVRNTYKDRVPEAQADAGSGRALHHA